MKLATLCYVRRGGETLMLHRVKKANDIHEGKWNGLGGKLEAGETPEACVIREVWEESGLRLRAPRLKGLLTFPRFANGEDWYAFVFVADDFEGELIDSPEGNLRWIPTAAIPDLNLWEGDRIFLPWLDQDGIFSALFAYEDGRLQAHSVVFYP
jgi:8-oxo-dGTP diphosphatase